MPRQRRGNKRESIRFPVGSYWEETLDRWEGDIGADPLGADHAARFEVIEKLLKRGFGTDQHPSRLVITRAQIASLAEPLGLADPSPLIDRLWEIAGRHLRPLHREFLGSDPKSSAATLAKVAKVAGQLEALLDRVAAVTRAFLREAHAQLPSTSRATKVLDINALDLALGDLALTTSVASNHIGRSANRPAKVLLRQTMHDALAAIEIATGHKVQNSWSAKGSKEYRFKGAGGELLRTFMKIVEPEASEQSLVKLMLDVRKSARPKVAPPRN